MFVAKAAIVGAGTMGAEIAQVIAAAGVPVVLKDVDQAIVERGLERARAVGRRRLAGLVEKGRLDEQEADSRFADFSGRIAASTSYEDFGDVDLVIEAVPERIELKRQTFAELDAVTPWRALLASNTSALPITELARATSRPEKVVGLHFFYPASVMRLVEVVEGAATSAETLRAAFGFALAIRKQPIRCRETPGFVVNRILNSAVSEVWRVHHQRGLDVEEVDRLIKDSGVAPMGPFFLADLLGLDTVLHVAEDLRERLGERFFVSRALSDLVAAGDLGQKSGRGFYDHAG